jgi:hypothetical protein
MVRDIPMPDYAGADFLADSWREISVTAAQDRRNIWDWQKVIDEGNFDVALDFSGDFYETKYCARGSLLRFCHAAHAPGLRPMGNLVPCSPPPS